MGVINIKVYLVVAIAIFAILFGSQLLGANAGAADFFRTVENDAIAARLSPTIANFIIGPFIWTFETQYYGPIVASLLWPISFIWLLLMAIVWVYSLIAPAFFDIPTG